MLAARADAVRALDVLIRRGANPNVRCKLPWANGKTARELAELEGRRRAARYLSDIGE